MDDVSFVIVGHVDHGKSTLIGRLLYDTDSLPIDKVEELKSACKALGRELEFSFITDHLQEEREQNVTIDTSQIKFKTKERGYTIIDAPGHKEFLRNMMTGASQAEAAIIIIDAQEGVREQTKRHASVLGLLGLTQVIVVVNKMDLAQFREERFEEVKKEIVDFLGGLTIKPSHVVPIVAKDGDNLQKKSERMPWYSGPVLVEALDRMGSKREAQTKPLRYPIQDVYKIADKRVLVGRVECGELSTGREIMFLPSKKRAVVTSIEVFGKEGVAQAGAGESIGITIAEPLFIERGEVACDPRHLPIIAKKIEASVFWLAERVFEKKERILLKVATQEVFCRVEHLKRIDSSTCEVIEPDASELRTAEIGRMVLVPEKPLVIEDFNETEALGRFVLEQDGETAAGGIVVSTQGKL